MCQDITLDAYAMYMKGMKIPEIKAAIDARYANYQQRR